MWARMYSTVVAPEMVYCQISKEMCHRCILTSMFTVYLGPGVLHNGHKTFPLKLLGLLWKRTVHHVKFLRLSLEDAVNVKL